MAPNAWFTTRPDGDFADPAAGPHPGRGVPERPWTWLRQVHGAGVVEVDGPGHRAGAAADGAVTAALGAALVVRTADCAPVALLAGEVVGVAHAGWRGLLAGVVEATVTRMRDLGAAEVTGIVGPCISARRYEFRGRELDELVDRYGPAVRAATVEGTPALDLRAGVHAALAAVGAKPDGRPVPCTASGPERFFSHRARADTGRQAAFVWLGS